MRPKLNERKAVISSYIQKYYLENDRLPSERDIASGTGIPPASVHRFLVEMRESGEISFRWVEKRPHGGIGACEPKEHSPRSRLCCLRPR